ncbi:hypothetical protein [Neorhodopirellula pilleata]|uniref:Uncharacterized protein n=1 Tax=Neorhodopirellula pilleata TaxID=2714738 RepID=A0A5C6AQW1_9BACT|nr:hypothetical protein [Neorhodopirellula pilleata]TWU01599.1 hypothetical protein Pla100_13340 [Neorhodopirellula pilleata]
MSLNTEIVLWCVVVPMTAACVAALLGKHLIARRVGVDETVTPRRSSGVGGITVGLGWWTGLVIAMAARQWMTAEVGWSQRLLGVEAWQTALWPLLLLTLVPSHAGDQRMTAARWVAAAVFACLLAYVAIPHGEAWQDSLHLHRPWSALMVASVVLNTFALDGLIRSGAKVWSLLVMIAGIGPAFLLASLNYAAPAEWTLAGIGATVGAMLAASWATIRASDQTNEPAQDNEAAIAGLSAAITLPVAGLIATTVTTARFYTWEEYPTWLYAVSLFLPTIVALVDFPLRRFSGKVRVPVAALVSAALIGACVGKLVLQEPPESW